MFAVDNPAHGYMIAHRAGVGYDPSVNRVLSRVDMNGAVYGGVVYTNYTRRSVQMHMAGEPGWATLKMVWIAFDYPFNQLKVERVLGAVGSHNEKVLSYDKRLGFKEVARIPDAVPGGDLVILSMMREECIWLRLRSRYIRTNGQAGELSSWEAAADR
jgi:hypothetical protein